MAREPRTTCGCGACPGWNSFRVRADRSAAPGQLGCDLTVQGQGLNLEGAGPILRAADLTPVLRGGELTGALRARVGFGGDVVRANVGIEEVTLSDGQRSLLGLGALRVDQLRLDPGADLSVTAVTLERASIHARLPAGGGVELFGLRMGPAADGDAAGVARDLELGRKDLFTAVDMQCQR